MHKSPAILYQTAFSRFSEVHLCPNLAEEGWEVCSKKRWIWGSGGDEGDMLRPFEQHECLTLPLHLPDLVRRSL